MLTPLACGVDATWERIIAGRSGAATISSFDADHLATNYACEIPLGDGSDGTYNSEDWMEPKEARKVDPFIRYGMCAADQAIAESGWVADTDEKQFRTGVMIGSGIGGLSTVADTAVLLKERGPRRVSPFFYTLSADKPRLRSGIDQIRLQGTKPCSRDRMFNRGTCHRRCRTVDRA